MNEGNGAKRLIRPLHGRLVAGVCAGVADYAGVDVNVVRLVVGVLTALTAGAFALAYLAAWVILPEEGESVSIAESLINKTRGS